MCQKSVKGTVLVKEVGIKDCRCICESVSTINMAKGEAFEGDSYSLCRGSPFVHILRLGIKLTLNLDRVPGLDSLMHTQHNARVQPSNEPAYFHLCIGREDEEASIVHIALRIGHGCSCIILHRRGKVPWLGRVITSSTRTSILWQSVKHRIWNLP